MFGINKRKEKQGAQGREESYSQPSYQPCQPRKRSRREKKEMEREFCRECGRPLVWVEEQEVMTGKIAYYRDSNFDRRIKEPVYETRTEGGYYRCSLGHKYRDSFFGFMKL